MKRLYVVAAGLCVVLLGGCVFGTQSETETPRDWMFATLVPITDINSSIVIVPQMKESGFTGAGTPRLTFRVENRSDSVVVLPFDLGTQILKYNDSNNEWTQYENLVTYSVTDDLMLYPNSSGKIWYASGAGIPDLQNSGVPITFRIVVMGRITESNEKVAAYADFNLAP